MKPLALTTLLLTLLLGLTLQGVLLSFDERDAYATLTIRGLHTLALAANLLSIVKQNSKAAFAMRWLTLPILVSFIMVKLTIIFFAADASALLALLALPYGMVPLYIAFYKK